LNFRDVGERDRSELFTSKWVINRGETGMGNLPRAVGIDSGSYSYGAVDLPSTAGVAIIKFFRWQDMVT